MSQSFTYKEIDIEGMDTLSVLSDADKLNKWFFDVIRPYCSGEILEVGSGIGNISQFFIENKLSITLSDLRSNYLEALSKRFPSFNEKKMILFDLVDPDFDSKYLHLFESFDTIFALNVVEHIEQDALAISNCHKLLKKGGNLIILVPAYQALYNRFDKELEHYKRYNNRSLNDLFIKADFKIVKSRYFNFAGIPGWFVSGRLLKNKIIPEGQLKFYNRLVPLFRIVDKLIFNRAGLSVITVGQK